MLLRAIILTIFALIKEILFFMRRLYISLLLLSICSIFSVYADGGVDDTQKIADDPKLRSGVLSNGMTYYLRHNERPKGQADFYILSAVGAIQEDDDQQGLAHFLEHMAFNGTKNFPDKTIINYLESIGVKFGANLNAATSWDYTVYQMTDVPTLREPVVDSAMMILHDWAAFIEPQPSEIDKERGVIKEELRTRDGADWRETLSLIAALGRGTRYAERNLIGHLDYLSSFEPEVLTRFYHDWYRPDYQAIIIVGDVDVDRVESRIKEMFGDIVPAKADAPQKEVIVVEDNEEPIVEIFSDPELRYSSASIYMKYPAGDKEGASTVGREREQLRRMFISLMQNARLDELSKESDAPFLGSSMHIGGIGIIPTMEAVIYSTSSEDGALEEAIHATVMEAERLRRYGFTQGEFERAKRDIMRVQQSAYLNRDDRRNNSFVQRYISNFRYGTPIPSAEHEWQVDSLLIANMTLNDINSEVEELYKNGVAHNSVIMISSPKKEGLDIPTREDVLTIVEQVEGGEVSLYQDQDVRESLLSEEQVRVIESGRSKVERVKRDNRMGSEEWLLTNGVRVIVKHTELRADEVVMSGYSSGGASRVDDEDYFAANILPYVMSQSGAGDFSSVELERQLAGHLVSLGSGVSDFSHTVSGSSSPDDLELMMQLVYLRFVHPRIDSTALVSVKRQLRASIENRDKNPDFIGAKRFAEVAYGGDIRRMPTTIEQVESLGVERLKEVDKALFGDADNFTFVIVGNVNTESLRPLVERYLGSLPTDAKSRQMRYVDDGVRPVDGVVVEHFSTKMEQPKVGVKILYSGKGVRYNMKNIVAANFLKAALDNMMLEQVREEIGGTYGVGVGISISDTPYRHFNLTISYDTNTELIGKTQEAVYEQLRKIVDEGTTEEQISKTREYLLKNYSNVMLERNSGWMSMIRALQYEHPLNYQRDYERAVKSITPSMVQKLAKSLLSTKNRVEVVMSPTVVE